MPVDEQRSESCLLPPSEHLARFLTSKAEHLTESSYESQQFCDLVPLLSIASKIALSIICTTYANVPGENGKASSAGFGP